MLKTVVGSLMAIATAPALSAFDLGEVDIHGFVSQGYLISNENDYLSSESEGGTFEYNEVGLNLATNVTDNLRVGVQLFSRDLGDWSNNELIVDWAFGDAYLRDEFSLRAGKVKTSTGLWQDIQDYDFLRVWSILPTSIYDPAARTFGSALYGVQGYGTFDLGAGGLLSYTASVGDVDISESGDIERLFLNDTIDSVDKADINVVIGLHLEYEPPIDGLRLVGTFNIIDEMDYEISGTVYGVEVLPGPTFLPYAAEVQVEFEFHRYDIITLGAEYLWNDWSFYAEYSRTLSEYTITTTSLAGTDSQDEEVDSDGFYLGAGYRLDDHWSFGGYFSGYWPDIDDRDGDDLAEDFHAWRYDLAVSVRYDFNEYWLVKGEAHFVNGAAGLGQYHDDDDDDLEENWQYFAIKTTFNF